MGHSSGVAAQPNCFDSNQLSRVLERDGTGNDEEMISKLNEAKTTLQLSRVLGLDCNGKEKEIIIKLMELEKRDIEKLKERVGVWWSDFLLHVADCCCLVHGFGDAVVILGAAEFNAKACSVVVFWVVVVLLCSMMADAAMVCWCSAAMAAIPISAVMDCCFVLSSQWHGVKQPRNPWSDGPEYITQCPIQLGANFNYEIIFSTEEASWFKGDVMELIQSALESGGEPNQSDAFTINGQPGDLYNCSKPGTFRILVDYGKTDLLHIINSILNAEMFFMVAQHNLTVVGMDGAYIKPINTDYIMITPGQTMDVLITAYQTPSEYYMAATAIVQYSGNYTAPSTPAFPILPNYTDIDAVSNFTRQMRALNSKEHPVDVPQTVDTKLYITLLVNTLPCVNSSCDEPNGDRLAASLNNISFVTPEVDVLQAYYNELKGLYTTDFPSQPPYFFNYTADDVSNDYLTPKNATKVKVLEFNSIVEIAFQSTNVMKAAEIIQCICMVTAFILLVLVLETLTMKLTLQGTIWLIHQRDLRYVRHSPLQKRKLGLAGQSSRDLIMSSSKYMVYSSLPSPIADLSSVSSTAATSTTVVEKFLAKGDLYVDKSEEMKVG
ncbi:Laccase-21 [Camellia lanceoleosa]|uniref:Laccase-21 n=1 Tax=Camellia lanceoleosa TaxID=1840588 RepID=A0ACC0GT79_9ERIC|nr:Laccase-21 [Camellia lanceoleosa]